MCVILRSSLLELLFAERSGIPILPIHIDTQPLDVAAMRDFVVGLEAQLNDSALALLREHVGAADDLSELKNVLLDVLAQLESPHAQLPHWNSCSSDFEVLANLQAIVSAMAKLTNQTACFQVTGVDSPHHSWLRTTYVGRCLGRCLRLSKPGRHVAYICCYGGDAAAEARILRSELCRQTGRTARLALNDTASASSRAASVRTYRTTSSRVRDAASYSWSGGASTPGVVNGGGGESSGGASHGAGASSGESSIAGMPPYYMSSTETAKTIAEVEEDGGVQGEVGRSASSRWRRVLASLPVVLRHARKKPQAASDVQRDQRSTVFIQAASLRDELQQCDCLIVLLTRRVLLEPMVLLAVWHAVDLGMPVFTVSLTNGGYNFDEAGKRLNSLRTSLSRDALALIEQQLPAGTGIVDFQQVLVETLMSLISLSWQSEAGEFHISLLVDQIRTRLARLQALRRDGDKSSLLQLSGVVQRFKATLGDANAV